MEWLNLCDGLPGNKLDRRMDICVLYASPFFEMQGLILVREQTLKQYSRWIDNWFSKLVN